MDEYLSYTLNWLKHAGRRFTVVKPVWLGKIGLLFLAMSVLAGQVHSQQPITVGGDVRVATSGQRLNLRTEPSLSASIVVRLENGTVMEVVAGPETADGYTWWKLAGEPGEGWAAGRFLQPVTAEGPLTEASMPTPSSPPRAPSPSGSPTARVADAYGFSGFCFLGWRWPTLTDSLPLEYDAVSSYDNVEEAAAFLRRAGFTTTTYENNRAQEAADRLSQDEIFFFYGHGDNDYLVFHDANCNYSGLTATTVQQIQAQRLQLSVLLGCSTGANVSDPDNIMSAFHSAGSRKVIGFDRAIWELGANHWNSLFWQYAVEDGLEVGDAAQKAANDAIYGIPWVVPSSLVILGQEDVYLVPEPVGGEEGGLSALPALIRTWLQEQWSALQAEAERRIDDWLRRKTESLLELIQREVERLLREICLAPLIPAALFGSALLRQRRYQSREINKE